MNRNTTQFPERRAESAEAPVVGRETTEETTPWFALRLFSSRQEEIAKMLENEGLEVFIPMEYVDVEDRRNHVKRVLRPVVRNLLFIKKTVCQKIMRGIIAALPYRVSIIRKTPGSIDYYEIPAREMFEFRAMCNPEILARKFLSEAQAKLKAGTPVMVTHGPLKGLQGKLVRSNKQYYLLKEVPGIGVMLKVTKWCCKPLL